jgi:protein SDA1
MIELYHKNVWYVFNQWYHTNPNFYRNDSKTVNIIAEACLMPVPKLVAPGLHFFLGTNDGKYDDDEEDDAVPDITGLKHANGINKKRKSRAHQMEKALAKVRRVGFHTPSKIV